MKNITKKLIYATSLGYLATTSGSQHNTTAFLHHKIVLKPHTCLTSDTQCENIDDKPLAFFKKLTKIPKKIQTFVHEANIRGLPERAFAGGVVGATGGIIRKSIGGQGNFSGAFGGVGVVNGAISGMLGTTLSVLSETLVGIVLKRTHDNKENVSYEENEKSRNLEQCISSIIGSGLASGLLDGAEAVKDGAIMGALGGVTSVVSKHAVSEIEKLLKQITGKNAKNDTLIKGKIKNILTLMLNGALAGGIMGKFGEKSLGIGKEILIAASRGTIRGLITQDENQREDSHTQ